MSFKSVHFKQRGYECQKAFGSIDNLQRHLEIHKAKEELANKSDSEDEDFEKSSNSEDTSDDGEDASDLHEGIAPDDDVGNENSTAFETSNDIGGRHISDSGGIKEPAKKDEDSQE